MCGDTRDSINTIASILLSRRKRRVDYGLYMRKERQYARGETKNKEQGGEPSLRVCMGIHMCYMSASSLGYCTVSV